MPAWLYASHIHIQKKSTHTCITMPLHAATWLRNQFLRSWGALLSYWTSEFRFRCGAMMRFAAKRLWPEAILLRLTPQGEPPWAPDAVQADCWQVHGIRKQGDNLSWPLWVFAHIHMWFNNKVLSLLEYPKCVHQRIETYANGGWENEWEKAKERKRQRERDRQIDGRTDKQTDAGLLSR